MSQYRNLTPWNKSSGSKLTSSSPSSSLKYDSTNSNRTSAADVRGKLTDDKKSIQRIQAPKFGNSSVYGSAYQRNNTSKDVVGNTYRSELPRLKSGTDRKDSLHPPVSYRPLIKTTSRSRDPSPVDRTERSSSSSTSYNRLAPPPFRRSASRERTTSTSSITSVSGSIPQYSGRLSSHKDDVSSGKKYGNIEKTDRMEDVASRYKNMGKATSREDISKSSSKYITSRFLPKNTIERSYSGYSRGTSSIAKANEASRKNREFLNVIQAQQEYGRRSRSVSTCSSINFDEPLIKSTESSRSEKLLAAEEAETVKVVTRSTSPTPPRSTSLIKPKMMNAKTIENEIKRRKRTTELVDKAIQSENTNDTMKGPKVPELNKITATPWNSILDMKFSSPNRKLSKSDSSESSNGDKKGLRKKESGNVVRTNSAKCVGHSCVPEDKFNNQKVNSVKSKLLPPQIPTRDSSSKSLQYLSNQQNKDFRKSILNMSDLAKKKVGRRSNSVSSADSESENQKDSEATDISENLTSCKSFHMPSSSSKLPQKVNSEKGTTNSRNRRSPSSELSLSFSSANASSNEEERTKNNETRREKPSLEKHLIDSALPRIQSPNNIMTKRESKFDDRVKWILDSNSDETSEKDTSLRQTNNTTNSITVDRDSWKPEKRSNILSHVESGEAPWWVQENAEVPEGVKIYSNWLAPDEQNNKSIRRNDSNGTMLQAPILNTSHAAAKSSSIKHIHSGEIPWWLDDNSEVPEGIQTYPNWRADKETDKVFNTIKTSASNISFWKNDSSESSSRREQNERLPLDGEYVVQKDEDGKILYKIRRNNSSNTSWWNDSTDPSEKNEVNKNQALDSEHLDLHKLRHIDSGERSWWLSSQENIDAISREEEENISKLKIQHEDSEEPAWWLQDDEKEFPLGDRASPEGLEMPKNDGRLSPYDNVPSVQNSKRPNALFISKHTNIDDILGGSGQIWSPLLEKLLIYQEEMKAEMETDATIINEGTSKVNLHNENTSMLQLDDAALQLYKDGDYGSYLDLDASISEQQEEFEGFQSNKKNSIVLRTQLSVRVHTIIEKLLTSEGRELRRALFSLKQIFQEDKDLVHEFVQNDGLSCLIKVGSEADQNYQNYILRALGQVMLYVDGMNGVMEHNQTIQWLYSLISSKFRLVVKTALKLLLVFVEYTDSNCMLLVKAVKAVDCSQGLLPWHNVMKLLRDFDAADTELLIYATTLINKVLNGVPDQDTYYDQTDSLEEQGIEHIIQRYMSKPGTDLDLLQQFQIYEAVLQYEDGEETGGNPFRLLDENVRKTLRCRKSVVDSAERRKSRRHSTGNYTSALQQRINNGINRNSSRKDLTPILNAVNKLDSEESLTKQPWILSMMYNNNSEDQKTSNEDDPEKANEKERDLLMQLKRENTVKDLTQKLASQNILHSPSEENKMNRIGDMSGLISKAKEGLAKSKSKADIMKSPTNENVPKFEVKKSENELRWEELAANIKRSLNLCDMDFTDLGSEDEVDILAPIQASNGIPPPPPPLLKDNYIAPPPPPLSSRMTGPPNPPPPVFGVNLQKPKSETKIPIKKNKKTVKLFWKEVREDVSNCSKPKTGHIWDELTPVPVDTQKLEHLFESRAKDLLTKEKQQEMNKNKEIIVLDPKRSNAINIGMTKLPPARSIKTAILKMDSTIVNREGIEKLLTMLPTKDERTKIQEAQAASPDLPLGTAEQFLLTLASISELPARLKLWAFKLDFENTEREIAEPLMDLKQGIEVLRVNKTFRGILSTLLSIGNFLNGVEVKGFQIEYLAKVPEVKDTVHKHSLLHHLCHIVMEKFPEASDLYSEIGAVTRASKVDFDELTQNINKLEEDCKASWDHLKLITKHDGSSMIKGKMSDFLSDCAERIILLSIIHRRIMNRFHKFLLWLGIPIHQISDTKPNEFCRIISEFALEYRTTRERVLQQLEKKANHRERNKTRGKMITDVGKFKTKEDRADAELRQLLGSDLSDVESFQGTLPLRRTRRDVNRSFLGNTNGNLTDGDDEILESLVKTATKGPSRIAPRERKRTRHADRKSLKRSRTRENNPYGSQDSP